MIAHESGVADTVDPLGGSYFIEEMTEQLYQQAQNLISKIDDLGGMVAAMAVEPVRTGRLMGGL